MVNAGLVLEGGGMKGIYTAGVLDYFMEQGLLFSHNYGVSAGAVMLCSYLSGQHGRSLRVYLDYINDKRYCSVYSLLTTGDLFGAKFCYYDIPERLIPFDYKTYEAFSGKAYAVVTDVVTGEPAYLPMKDLHKDIEAVRASASMPLVSRMVTIEGRKYLDGGMSDAIPLHKCMADGNQKSVVIMTKEEGYVRKPMKHAKLLRLRYPFRKKLVECMANRHIPYNEVQDFMSDPAQKDSVFVIRPKKKSEVGRIEKDTKKLRALYEEGYADAKACYPALCEFLGISQEKESR